MVGECIQPQNGVGSDRLLFEKEKMKAEDSTRLKSEDWCSITIAL